MKTKTESLLEDLDKFDDEQIIELTDVVEEPESRVRIDDLMASEKEEVPGEIADLVSLEKQLEKVTQPPEEELSLSLGEAIKEEVKPKAAAPPAPKEAKGEELFEKVALEEIFLKMEQLKPAIEKELLGEEEVHIAEEVPSATAETTEKPFSLEEFEAALEKEPMPKPEEKMMQPFMPEPPKREAPKKEVLPEIPPFDLPAFEIPTKEEAKTASVEALWSEEMKGVKEEPLKEVLSSKSLLEEEDLTMEALEQALGPLVQAEAKKAVMPKAPAKELIIEEEPLAELVEEEFPQELLAEAELAKEKLPEEELGEEEFPKALLEEERIEEAVAVPEEPKGEEIGEIEKVMEEVAAPTPLQAEEIRMAETSLEQKVIAPEECPPPSPASPVVE